jgi:hypothetical protein
MKENMIYGLSTPLTHTTPVYHYDVLSSSSYPKLRSSLEPPSTQRMPLSKEPYLSKYSSKEMGASRNGQRMIKGSYFKRSTFWRDPTYFILIALSQFDRVQKIKERSDQIHLPIMHCLVNDIFHLKISIRELYMICHPHLLTSQILNNSGKVTFRGWSPHYKSCQNLIFDPSPTSYLTNLEKTPHPS